MLIWTKHPRRRELLQPELQVCQKSIAAAPTTQIFVPAANRVSGIPRATTELQAPVASTCGSASGSNSRERERGPLVVPPCPHEIHEVRAGKLREDKSLSLNDQRESEIPSRSTFTCWYTSFPVVTMLYAAIRAHDLCPVDVQQQEGCQKCHRS